VGLGPAQKALCSNPDFHKWLPEETGWFRFESRARSFAVA